MSETHLCIVIDRHTKEQIGDEQIIVADDWYYARHIMANRFREANPDEKRDWCVDSLKLDD